MTPSPRLVALALALFVLAPLARAENNTTNLVNGVVSNYAGGTYYDGNTGTNNALLVVNGGLFTNIATAYIGYAASSLSNSALVSGAGSLLQVNGQMIVGDSGRGSSLMVNSNGQVTAASFYVGTFAGSSGRVLLDGGSLSVASGIAYVGYQGTANMIVSNGTLFASSSGITVGNSAGSSGSLAIYGTSTVTGGSLTVGGLAGSTGSVLLVGGTLGTAANDLYVGNTGVGSLTVSGGSLLAASGIVGFQAGASGNLWIGGGSNVTKNMTLGYAAGSTGRLVVAGGSLTVTNSSFIVGNNGVGSVIVSNGSLLTAGANLGSGASGSGSVAIYGGTMENRGNTAIGGSSLGTLLLAGGTLITTNGTTSVGYTIFGSLTTSNGTWMSGTTVVGSSGGPGAVGSLSLIGGTNQFLGNLTAGATTSSTGFVNVAGGVLTVTNASLNGTLVLGNLAGLGVYTQTAGNVTVDALTINNNPSNVFAFSGGTFTINNGSTLSTNSLLNLGRSGGGAPSMSVLGGTNSWRAGVILGGSAGATGALSFAGGILAVSNNLGNATFTVGQGGLGVYTQSGGAAVVNRLIATNGANSIFVLNGGSFTVTSGSWVNTGAPFSLGSVGGNSVTVALLGLTNSWANGFSLGDAAGATGTLILAGGTFAMPSNVVVGNLGVGNLVVSNGGFQGQGLVLGNSAGAKGTLALAGGTNLLANLALGAAAGSTGTLNVAGGTFALTNATGNSVFAFNQPGFGIYTQTAGSVILDQVALTNAANGLFVFNGGALTIKNGLTIDNGAPFVLATTAGTGSTILNLLNGTNSLPGGILVGGTLGTLTSIVNVAGGVLTVTNAAGNALFSVGQSNGRGIYTQSAGNVTVDLLALTNLGNSTFLLNGGTFNILHGSTANVGFVVGQLAGNAAAVNLLGGTNNWSNGAAVGAVAGSTGSLTVADGARLNLGLTSLLVGSNGVGFLTTSNSTLLAGSATVGNLASSSGGWTALGGSNLLIGSLTLGSAAGSTGQAYFVGTYVSNGSALAVGSSGAGSLVSSNSTLNLGSVTLAGASGGSGSWIDYGSSNLIRSTLSIAVSINGRGAVTLSNSTTILTSSLILAGGSGATGSLALIGGSFTAAGGLDLVRGIGGFGQVLIDGGATLLNTQSLFATEIGNKGVALFTVSNGTYLGRTTTLGSNAGAYATFAIAGGTAQFGGDVVLGFRPGATGIVKFSSGLFTATNAAGTAALVVGRAGYGSYNQDGGDATVDRLVATNGANSVFAFGGATFNVLHGANVANGQVLAIGTNGPAASAMRLLGDASTLGDLLVGPYGSLVVSNGASLNVAGWVTNSGTIALDHATVTYQKPVQVDGGFLNDLSTATFKTNLVVSPSGWLAGSTGGTFAMEKDLLLQSTNLGQFNLAYSALLFSNGPSHTLDISGSGAKDLGSFTNFADVAANLGIGQLNLAFGDSLTLTGTKSGALTNALYVGAFNVQGLGSAPYLTNSFLDVSNTLASILSLPNINLYFDPTDPRNDWLVNNMPDGGYNFWGGGSLTSRSLLPIPEPSALVIMVLGGTTLALTARRRSRPPGK